MPLNECARSHVKVCSIVFVQWHAKCGGVLVRARAHNRSMLKRTIGALEPKVSVMNFTTHRQDPSN
jgi:non-ribosomal peptide synthetase component F